MKTPLLFILFLYLIVLHDTSYAQYKTLNFAGINRTYLLHIPPSYNQSSSVPLVIALHNAYGSGNDFQSMTGFSTKANSNGFIVVYPNGTGNPTSWNGSGCCFSAMTNNVDDVGFISALIDTLKDSYNIDTARIYAAGFSNGSIMAYRLAAELSPKIAAIAAVAGPMMLDSINPARPVPIIHIHALDDNAVPYDGGAASSGYHFPSVKSVLDTWIGINHCTTEPDTFYNSSSVTGIKWEALNNNADIILYTTSTGGHSWPTINISATDTIWNFFAAHPSHSALNAIDYNGNSINHFDLKQNYPNPFNPSTNIAFELPSKSIVTLKVFDLLGREVVSLISDELSAGNHALQWNAEGMPSGVYFYCLQVDSFKETKKLILLR